MVVRLPPLSKRPTRGIEFHRTSSRGPLSILDRFLEFCRAVSAARGRGGAKGDPSVIDVRHDLALDECPQGGAEHFVLLAEHLHHDEVPGSVALRLDSMTLPTPNSTAGPRFIARARSRAAPAMSEGHHRIRERDEAPREVHPPRSRSSGFVRIVALPRARCDACARAG